MKVETGSREWFYLKMERGQSNVMLRHIQKNPQLPPGIDPNEVLKTCLKDYARRGDGFHVTTVDEKILFKFLGTGTFSDESLRDVIVHASPYAIMDFHQKKPDLLPVELVAKRLREGEVRALLDLYFVTRRRDDKRLASFVKKLEKIPGYAEIVAVYAVHGL